MKVLCISLLLATFAIMGAVGGCTTNDAPSGDDGETQREECSRKVSACINHCYKSGLGPACTACCQRNGVACDMGESYGFYSCRNAE